MKKKIVVLALAAVLVFGCAVGGTLAWLMDKSDAVVNTFTYGDINIELTETDADGNGNNAINSYEMIPGTTITKDPVVTVKADSEDCWLIVKIDESNNWPAFLTYEMAAGWTEVAEGVYAREVAYNKTNDQPFHVIKDDKLTVDGATATKSAFEAIGINYPEMTVTAYAVQKTAANTAAAAWALAQVEANY